MSPHPLLIDVDTGIDDAFGLLFALGRPDADVIGVSTVAGNVSLAKATRNTRAVLALAGREDVPVWPGLAEPLLKRPKDASDIHGETGLGYAEISEPAAPASTTHAVEAILAASRAHAGELVLVATGPLSNIAAALLSDPDLPKRVKRFVLMGGAFKDAGNVTPTAEFNIWHDPEAARIVFRAFSAAEAAPLIAIGLDVTRRTLLTREHLDELARRLAPHARGAAISRFLANSSRYYFELMEKWGRARALVMHDPLAVGVAIQPDYVTTTRAHVDVETSGELTAGMTIADWRPNAPPAPRIEVALEVSAEAFLADYLDAVERLARG